MSRKLLTDSGFSNIINIDGGMTAFQQLQSVWFKNLIETKLDYNIMSGAALCNKINDKNIFLLDVCSDSAFKYITGNAKTNAMRYFKNSTHITLADIETNLDKIPVAKEIIIIDIFGKAAAKAAAILKKNNYKQVSILPEGIDRVFYSESKALLCVQANYISPVSYPLSACPISYPILKSRGLFIIVYKNCRRVYQ